MGTKRCGWCWNWKHELWKVWINLLLAVANEDVESQRERERFHNTRRVHNMAMTTNKAILKFLYDLTRARCVIKASSEALLNQGDQDVELFVSQRHEMLWHHSLYIKSQPRIKCYENSLAFGNYVAGWLVTEWTKDFCIISYLTFI